MPTYEYHCRRCDHRFERTEHISEHESTQGPCPKCGADEVEPVLTPFYAKTAKKS